MKGKGKWWLGILAVAGCCFVSLNIAWSLKESLDDFGYYLLNRLLNLNVDTEILAGAALIAFTILSGLTTLIHVFVPAKRIVHFAFVGTLSFALAGLVGFYIQKFTAGITYNQEFPFLLHVGVAVGIWLFFSVGFIFWVAALSQATPRRDV